MVYRIVPRTEIGLPEKVTSASGVARQPLVNEQFFVVHYTGNNIDYTGSDGAEVVRQIQRVFARTKPFEYNYAIDQSDDDRIFEYAGKFQAAHSGGENHDSFGVLLINGIHDSVTDTQVGKLQWLRDVLVYTGLLRAQPEQRPHKFMPGAATACAGPYVDARWSEIVRPYQAPGRYDPAANQWAIWPRVAKPTIQFNHRGPEALYLNDALRIKAGQMTCGDIYNQSTAQGVANMANWWNAHYPSLPLDEVSFVGPQMWGVIDWLTTQ